MLQVPFIRENKDLVIAGLAKRNFEASSLINEVISLDEDRRRIQTELDSLLAESNSLSKEIGNLFKSGETQKANILKEKTGQIKEITKGMRLDRYKTHDIEVVIDRLLVNKSIENRLEETIKTALYSGNNILMVIDIEDNSVLIEKDVVPVSRRNRPQLMKSLKLL